MFMNMDGAPTELVEVVLKALLADPEFTHQNKVTTLLCVSPQWRDVGLKLLYTNVVLGTDTISTFVHGGHPKNNDLIRNLTINITPPQPRRGMVSGKLRRLEDVEHIEQFGNEATQQLWSEIGTLTTILPQMTNLTTFSLFVQPTIKGTPSRGFFLRTRDVCTIVLSLQPSIENVEIDTRSFHKDVVSDSPDEPHLCQIFGSLLPSLKHARLRLLYLCSKIVPVGDLRKLESLNLSFTGMGITKKADVQLNLTCGTDQGREIEHYHSPCNSSKLAEVLGNLQISKVSPQCEIKVFEHALNSAERGEEVFIIRDILKYKLTIMPCHQVMDDFAMRRPKENDMDEELYGSFVELSEAFDGSAWMETTSGARFPAAYKQTTAGREMQWKRYMSPNKAQFLEKIGWPRLTTQLWNQEARAGRPLLCARITDGALGEVESLWREKLPNAPSEDHEIAGEVVSWG